MLRARDGLSSADIENLLSRTAAEFFNLKI
jgi:hypothetical protein